MTQTDDTAALIERLAEIRATAEQYEREDRLDALFLSGDVALALLRALERAQADAARMREALEGLLHIEPRGLGHVDTIRAYQAARAALEPRP